jgi:hypothetical protein
MMIFTVTATVNAQVFESKCSIFQLSMISSKNKQIKNNESDHDFMIYERNKCVKKKVTMSTWFMSKSLILNLIC